MDTLDQETPPAPKPPQKGGVGPILGIIIIIILIALSGLYYFTEKVDTLEIPGASQY